MGIAKELYRVTRLGGYIVWIVADATVKGSETGSSLYVYRPDELERALQGQEVHCFLTTCGYSRFDAAGALQTLRKHLKDTAAFPHEIGVFLGYPLADVLGFIENCGRNCLACGCWKVYSDLCFALQTFQRYDKCKTVYQRLFAQGCPLTRLTVAARPA